MAVFKLLPPATVAAKYAIVAAETEAVKHGGIYASALAKVRSISGSSGTVAALSIASTVSPVNLGPAVTVDIAADGLMSSLRNLFTDAMLRAVPMTGKKMFKKSFFLSKYLTITAMRR